MSSSSIPARRLLPTFTPWRSIAFIGDVSVFVLSTLLAFQLRFDGAVPPKYFRSLWISVTCLALAKAVAFAYCRVNRSHWKSTSVYDAKQIALANTAGSILGGFVVIAILGPWGIPRTLYILDWIICCFFTGGVRLTVRIARTVQRTRRTNGDGTKTLIYGAGSAGHQLLRELRENRTLMSNVVGFIDDDPAKAGLIFDGKHVLGAGGALAHIAKKHAVERLLIFIPSATNRQSRAPS